MISALYIVSYDGRPIYYYDATSAEEFNVGITEATLFSGIITAIQSVMKQIDAGQVSNFNTEKNTIYLKSENNLVYVAVLPLKSELTRAQIDQFFDLIVENLPLQGRSKDFMLSREEDMMLNTVVKMLYNQWEQTLKESKASKKLKEDLW